jgi:tripartite-type tricarboxylate transporter receptor subunit TctC
MAGHTFRRCAIGPLVCLLLLAWFAAVLDCARAQTPDSFFRGKTIDYYVGFSVGGAYDFYARLAARFLGKHIPGNPTVVVQTMTGAGSLQAANFLYWNAPKDGTAIGTVTETLALEEALHTPGVRYKAAEFTWIGRITSSLQVAVSWKNSAKTVEEAKHVEVAMASTGAGSSSTGFPKLLNALAGTRFKIIAGFASSPQGMLAMENGDVDAVQSSWNTLKRTKQDWLRDHDVNVLYQCALQRQPDLPDIPTTVELGVTPEAKDLLAFYTSSAEVGQSILAPPGVPADRAEILRAGFQAMLKDPDFLAEFERAQDEVHSAPAEAVQKIVTETANAPSEITARIMSILHSP